MADEQPKRKYSLLAPMRRTSMAQEGHGVEAGADLDEEMEKVFSSADGERFNVAKLGVSPDSTGSKRSFGEKDYSLHRKKSYPHVHTPLKSIHSRSMRRQVASPRESESDSTDVPTPADISTDDVRRHSISETDTIMDGPTLSTYTADSSPRTDVHPEDDDDEDKEELLILSIDSEPQVSERAASHGNDPEYASSLDRRVQFQIDIAEKPEEALLAAEEEDDEEERKDSLVDDTTSKEERKAKRKHGRHHHHRSFRKYSLPEDPQWRKRSGSEFGLPHTRRISIQPEEASTMQQQDIDDLTSHRFDDARGVRRYKLQTKTPPPSLVHISRKEHRELPIVLPIATLKKMFDHSPHEVFVQLDELHGIGEEREWKETARWIKYEEDVEEGADRWGRPHVASLSFHSLLNLRRCLETGVVLLDLEEKDLTGVAHRVVEQMVVDELIAAEDKPTVMRALLLRHRHVNGHERFRFGMKRTFSSYTSLQNLNEDRKPKIIPSNASIEMSISKSNNHMKHEESEKVDHTVDIKEETYASSSEDLKKVQNENILKRIPFGAEATTVLVGAVDFLEQPTIAFVRLAEGILMPSITEVSIPVRFLFILLGPTTANLDYHEIGRSISTLMSNTQFHKIAYKADERRELLSAINEFLDDSIVVPPGDWERKALLPFEDLKAKSEMIRRRKSTRTQVDPEIQKALIAAEDEKPPFDDPLRRTRHLFGGLINDVKRRFPHYSSDIKDGLNLQCLAAAIFIYFAAVSAAITFGGIMGDKTDNLIGISETLISTSAAGIIFALLSGQPLIIIGTTGPLLLFDESLFNFCYEQGINFLTLRVYIGLWLGIIALVVVCFEGSVLVKLFTRFTEELFAALISLLYIVESFIKLAMVFHKHPLLDDYCLEDDLFNSTDYSDNVTKPTLSSLSHILDDNNLTNTGLQRDNSTITSTLMRGSYHGPFDQPNTALFCTILALGTFFIAYYLRQFRNSKFLGRNARRALGDFGVPIAIVTMVVLDYLVPNVYSEKLKVPEGLSPSSPGMRGWLVSPTDLPSVGLAFAAVAPALLVYILLFMETHICELIVDKKDRNLKKGTGFHIDIVIVCIMNVGCGFMGAPWMCAATVRSIAHVSAITIMSRTHAPGDKPHIIDVKEQRLSALVVSVLVGLSVLMAPLLRMVPMAVLFGVFLYMGVSSTNGIQFFERLQLFFMPVKHHPQTAYVRRVQTMKMHLFTVIQLLCLAILWIVKSTEASLAFPFFLILMVPLRAQLRFLFTPSELRALDSQEVDSEDAEEDEPDFYTEAPLPG